MKRSYVVGTAMLLSLCALFAQAQQTVATNTNVAVPPLVNFSGTLIDSNGKPLTGPVNVTFSLYSEQTGGAALWMETQNVTTDNQGHYTVMLGSTSSTGLPSEIFVAGQAHWLGVQVQGQPQEEQPRVLLVSAPYALKAGDAETIGGFPPSAFVLAAPSAGAVNSASANAPAGANPPTNPDVTGKGTVNFIPLWDSTSDIISSVLYQSGSGSTVKLGVNNTTPAATLDVKGTANLRGTTSVMGTLSLPATGTATASEGKDSQPITQTASAYNGSTGTAVNQKFQWQAEAINNDTSTASGTLNLLYGQGANTAAETGLHIASNGQITFATGQTFPGTGDGTITGVTPGTGLTGGGTAGSVTLSNTGVLGVSAGSGISLGGTAQNPVIASTGVLGVSAGTGISVSSGQTPTIGINTSAVPQLNATNTFTGNQTVNGNLTATGVVTGSSYQIGSNLFGFGSYSSYNAFLGFSGSAAANAAVVSDTAVGVLALQSDEFGDNTAVGTAALQVNTTGGYNTANGGYALSLNTTGSNNAASGASGLFSNTTGSGNAASGAFALFFNTTGSDNTASGAFALYSNATSSQNTATGYEALITATSCCNTAMGNVALQHVTTGLANTGVGNNAGATTDTTEVTGNNNTFLGTGTKMLTGDLTNATALGANAEVDESNALVLGSVNGKNGQTVTVNVGIGTTQPDANLSVNGTADKVGGGSWGTYSDRRLKNLDGSFRSGLSQIMQINPVLYRYKAQNAMGISDHEEHVGLVAQEVQKVIPQAVTQNGKGYLLVNNDPIIWTMLNAIKEQQREIAVLRAQLRNRAAKEARLESRLTQLEHGRTERTSLASADASGNAVLK